MKHGVLLGRGGDTDRVVFEDFTHKNVVYVSATTFQSRVERGGHECRSTENE